MSGHFDFSCFLCSKTFHLDYGEKTTKVNKHMIFDHAWSSERAKNIVWVSRTTLVASDTEP